MSDATDLASLRAQLEAVTKERDHAAQDRGHWTEVATAAIARAEIAEAAHVESQANGAREAIARRAAEKELERWRATKTGRHENAAREQLGEVRQHHDGLPGAIGNSHGCVGVMNAVKVLSDALADGDNVRCLLATSERNAAALMEALDLALQVAFDDPSADIEAALSPDAGAGWFSEAEVVQAIDVTWEEARGFTGSRGAGYADTILVRIRAARGTKP